MHRLLRRQLAKHIADYDALSDEAKALLRAVDQAYEQAESDRLLLERTLDLSSDELLERNVKLSEQMREIELTREKLRQNQLELAQVARLSTMGEMAASIAHELNQPLAAIVAYIGGIQARIKGGEAVAPDIAGAFDAVAEQSLRAGRIIRRIREFIRKGEHQPEPVDVNRPVRDAVDLLKPDAAAEDVVIVVSLASDLPPVLADVVQIEQVVVNLGRNAIDALAGVAGRRRELVVHTMKERDRIVVAVRDNGAGMSGEAEEKLFTPFFTTKPRGMGMGLAICRTIAEIHHGELRYGRPAAGGAEFRLSLPAYSGEATNPLSAPGGTQ